MLNFLHKFHKNSQPYFFDRRSWDYWQEVTKRDAETDTLLLIFQRLCHSFQRRQEKETPAVPQSKFSSWVKKGTQWIWLLICHQSSLPYGKCFFRVSDLLSWEDPTVAVSRSRDSSAFVASIARTKKRPESFRFYLVLWHKWMPWSQKKLLRRYPRREALREVDCKERVPNALRGQQTAFEELWHVDSGAL